MSEIDLERLRELFDDVVELPDGERAAHLATLTCDPALREHVLRLARASDARTSRATRVARQLGEMVESVAGPEVGVGDVLGAWTLVRELGSGGMGAVFLAERSDGQFEQRAAIKVLQGVPSPVTLALLASERQILAKLSHPGIARLYDGGATAQGRPYLVMEYVEGVALDAYSAAGPPSVASTLRLFVQVCEAVAFAHARLIVHCDLKPSNILVDPAGRPVLLDFGIARLLDRSAADASAPAARAFTPRYASPELRSGAEVGTAADVYALGLILGELLAGRLDADLSAIVARATAASAADRYPSVPLLLLDLARYQERRPVSARIPRWHYRLRLLLRRRWPAFLVLALFGGTVTLFTARVLQERDRALAAEAAALREAATAQAISVFLQDLFRGADPDAGGRREITALALVERGSARIDQDLAAQPATRADLWAAVARVYANLGEPVQAEAGFQRALAIERGLPVPRPERLIALLVDLAELFGRRNRYAEAEPLAQEALRLGETIAAGAPRSVLDALAVLASVRSGLMQFDAADALLARLLLLRQRLGDADHQLAETWYAMGENAMQRGDLPRALVEYGRSEVALRQQFGEVHPRTLEARQQLAVALARSGRLDEAEVLLRRILQQRLELHGERSSKVSSVQSELAYLLTQQGHYIESAAMTEQVLAHDASVEGEQSPVYARTLNNLAFAYQNMGDVERCVAAFQRSLAIRAATLPAGDLAIARAQNNLARFLMWLGRIDEARPLVEGALAIRVASLPPEHEERIESLISAMEWARRAGDLAGARAHWSGIEPHLERVHAYTRLEARRTLAWLAVSEQRPEARQHIAAYIDGLKAALGATHPSILRGRVAAAEMLEVLGARADARREALALQQEFGALVRAYPAHSVFHQRLRRLVAAGRAEP